MPHLSSSKLFRLSVSRLPKSYVRVPVSTRHFSLHSVPSGNFNPLPLIALSAALGGAAYYYYNHRQSKTVSSPVVQAFERGDLPEEYNRGAANTATTSTTTPSSSDKSFSSSDPLYLPRPELEAQLATLLQSDDLSQFVVITGPDNVGRSEMIRHVVRGLSQPRGVLYTYIPPVTSMHNYGIRLARWMKSKHSGRMDVRWGDVAYELELAALDYKITHQRPMVLVIDMVELLPPEELNQLLDFVRHCVDSRTLRIVLCVSSGSKLLQLTSHAAYALAAPPVYVPALPDSLARRLARSCGVPPEAEAELVDTISGGDCKLIRDFAKHAGGQSVQDLRRSLDGRRSALLSMAHLPATHPLFSAVLRGEQAGVSVATALKEGEGGFRLTAHQLELLLDDGLLAIRLRDDAAKATVGAWADRLVLDFADPHAKDFLQREAGRGGAGGLFGWLWGG